jgi:ABC-type branched-subunit amino acid transport system substrate-binding protein
MQTRDIRKAGRWLAVAALAGSALLAQAQKRYDPGATDTAIKIGNTMPYSGPASVYGTVGKSAAAYFRKVNAEGGIGGRKIEFISLDDAYSPPVAVEQTRKLVEQQKVLLIFGPLGTPTNAATQKYLNIRKVPQLFVSSGAERWGDHRQFPWSIGFNPTYVTEGRIYAAHILASRPDAKVAVLYQNDEFGKDIVRGLLDGLCDKARSMVVAQASYEVSDPTVDSQIISLRSSGADTLMNFSQTKFAAQTIRKMAAIGWKPRALPDQRVELGGGGAQAGRRRACEGPPHCHLPARSERRPRHAGGSRLRGLHVAVLTRGRPERHAQRHGLLDGAGAGAAADPGRRRSDPRQPHEAGREPRHDLADALSGHPPEDRARQLLSDPADAAGALRRHRL